MRKKILYALFIFVLALTVLAPQTVFADLQKQEDDSEIVLSGWIKEEYSFHGDTYVDWYYADSNGNLVTGWQFINGKWYYFGKDFVMYSDGMYEIGGKYYFFYPSGAMGTGWIARTFEYGDGSSDIVWYYASDSGALVSGWQWIGNAWYYFYPNYYYMVSNSECSVGGKMYFFDKSGKMCTGWGKMNITYDSGYTMDHWYYADSSGALLKGWQKIGGVWYYFSYNMFTGTEFIDGEMQAFDGNGAWTTKPGWLEVKVGRDSTWYYLDAKGKPMTGWQKINGVWYYFNDFYGGMYSNCSQHIDGKYYAFDKSGAWVSGTGWKKITNYDGTSNWIYVKDGVVQEGWQYIGGAWYYLSYSGRMVTGNYVVDGIIEQFSSSGAWLGNSTKTGWVKIDTFNRWVYVEDADGTLAKGWKTIDGVTYYFEPYDYYMSYNDLYWIDGDYYYFDKSGALRTGFITTEWGNIYYANEDGIPQTGWQTIDGYKCYFDPYGFQMYHGETREIDGKKYNFDSSGRLMAE